MRAGVYRAVFYAGCVWFLVAMVAVLPWATMALTMWAVFGMGMVAGVLLCIIRLRLQRRAQPPQPVTPLAPYEWELDAWELRQALWHSWWQLGLRSGKFTEREAVAAIADVPNAHAQARIVAELRLLANDTPNAAAVRWLVEVLTGMRGTGPSGVPLRDYQGGKPRTHLRAVGGR